MAPVAARGWRLLWQQLLRLRSSKKPRKGVAAPAWRMDMDLYWVWRGRGQKGVFRPSGANCKWLQVNISGLAVVNPEIQAISGGFSGYGRRGISWLQVNASKLALPVAGQNTALRFFTLKFTTDGGFELNLRGRRSIMVPAVRFSKAVFSCRWFNAP